MDSPLAQVANVLADVAGTNPATGTWRYYSHDHLASTRRMRASDGFSLATYEYTPYGEQYAVSGMASASHQYAMLTWDETAQLHFAPFRYYSPQRSMWISPDPLGMVDGSNTYIYVQAGPIATVDPLGLLAGIIIAGLFIIGGAAAAAFTGSIDGPLESVYKMRMDAEHGNRIRRFQEGSGPRDEQEAYRLSAQHFQHSAPNLVRSGAYAGTSIYLQGPMVGSTKAGLAAAEAAQNLANMANLSKCELRVPSPPVRWTPR